jgi:hypothetical protein
MLGTVGGETGAPGRLPMLGTLGGDGGAPMVPMDGVEPGCVAAPGWLPMLGTVGGCAGPRLPMLGTVVGGGGHTLEGEAACARRYDASVSPAKSMLTRRATLMPPAYSSRAGKGGFA